VRDAVVVGGGPNGLSAAIRLADAGVAVRLLERAEQVGGGVHSAELTLPGHVHDVCAAAFPLAIGSPWLRTLELERYGLEWVQPELPLAHPLEGDDAVVLHRSLEETARGLGADGDAWRRLMEPVARHWEALSRDLLAPLSPPSHPLRMARFALDGLRSARGLAMRRFRGARARALFGGNAAHAMLPLESAATAAFGIVLGASAHAVGWPLVRGGAGRLALALRARLERAGGRIETGVHVRTLEGLGADAVLLDLTPRQVLAVAGDRLPYAYRRRLERFRYGPAVFKMDWALSEPIPWRAEACRRAGTVHVGGSLEEIAAAEHAAHERRHAERPFVLVVQPSLFDDRRAPPGRHTAWAYCHVPFGWTVDMSDAIEAQIERWAPGFRDTIRARSTIDATRLEAMNPNMVGGHINGGSQDVRQLFFRPAPRLDPYRTPVPGLWLCSASTPPGGGVHGMCGYWAAESVLG